jgi:hypothetical protein
MLSKKERTWEAYVEAGATMRLANEILCRLGVDLSQILPAKESDRLLRFYWGIFSHLNSCAEEQLFQDFHEMVEAGKGHDMIRVFYGNLSREPENEIDAEVIKKAKEIADGFFK